MNSLALEINYFVFINDSIFCAYFRCGRFITQINVNKKNILSMEKKYERNAPESFAKLMTAIVKSYKPIYDCTATHYNHPMNYFFEMSYDIKYWRIWNYQSINCAVNNDII